MTEKKLEIPDLVGDAGRAEIVASAIRDLQVQKERLGIMQTINGAGDDEKVPDSPFTFTERREQIDAAIGKLAEDNPAAMAVILESVRGATT